HVELTTLLVPGLNDSEEEIRRLVDWVAALSPDIPLHFTRYFPNYKFDLPPTPLETLKRAREIALEKLHYVYLGNVPGT
ncbi:MAG: AmmeMemoRadiSam system radical SAM enzyme, partial [Desulfofundulus sp.]